jgi:hypothetical protein
VAIRGLTFKLGADTRDAQLKLDEAKVSLSELTDRAHNINIGIKDKVAQVELLKINQEVDRLSRKTAKPNVSMRGADRALLDVAKLDLAIDALDKKSVRAGGRGIFGMLGSAGKGLFSFKGATSLLNLGKDGEGLGSGSGLLDIAGSPVGLGSIGLLASMLPALLGGAASLGIGGLVLQFGFVT